MRFRISFFSWIALFAIISVYGLSISSATPVSPKNVGDEVPSFTFVDVSGEKASLDEVLEKYDLVVVNFWGLRCASCIQEIPHLNEMSEKYSRKVKFLGINADAVDGGFLREQMEYMGLEIRYTIVPDPEFKLIDLFGLTAAPLTVVIGKDGKVVYIHEGYNLGDEKKLEKAIKNYLNEHGSGKIGSK